MEAGKHFARLPQRCGSKQKARGNRPGAGRDQWSAQWSTAAFADSGVRITVGTAGVTGVVDTGVCSATSEGKESPAALDCVRSLSTDGNVTDPREHGSRTRDRRMPRRRDGSGAEGGCGTRLARGTG